MSTNKLSNSNAMSVQRMRNLGDSTNLYSQQQQQKIWKVQKNEKKSFECIWGKFFFSHKFSSLKNSTTDHWHTFKYEKKEMFNDLLSSVWNLFLFCN